MKFVTRVTFNGTRIHLVLFVLLAFAGGCAPTDAGRTSTTKSSEPSDSADSFPFEAEDTLGRRVVFQRRAQSIVSLSPRTTELLFAIGAGDQVKGVTSYCNYPPEASARAKVGGFSQVSVEKVIELNPDLVVCGGGIHAPTISQLDQLGIPILGLEANTFSELYRDIELLGRATGHLAEARGVRDAIEERLDKVATALSDIDSANGPRVYYHVWDEPLTAAGQSSYFGQLIEHSGGVNVISEMTKPYPQISEEVILDRDPQFIFAARYNSMQTEPYVARPTWSQVTAVKNSQIYYIDGDLASRFGPRIVRVLEAMAAVMHPDRFDAVDEAVISRSNSGSRETKE